MSCELGVGSWELRITNYVDAFAQRVALRLSGLPQAITNYELPSPLTLL